MACVYRMPDNKCEKGSCEDYASYCGFDDTSDCVWYKQSNADRIRAMSDEELAKYFSSIAECDHCQNELDRECCVNEDTCINRWLEWLKSED